jgi:YHS domain-containing protein
VPPMPRQGLGLVRALLSTGVEDSEMEKDPVCGRAITPENVAAMTDYQGRRYYFCCAECQLRFERDPVRFALQRLEDKARHDDG